MRILVAGATGTLGRHITPLLIGSGHEVAGLFRSAEKAAELRQRGVEPLVADALDGQAVTAAVHRFKPEVIIHELTALRSMDVRNFDRTFAATNRLRTTATEHLLAAGRAVGARRFIAQSFAGWPYARTGDAIKTEDDPLDPNPVPSMRPTLMAIRQLEGLVTSAGSIEGLVLRYGVLFGPGTSFDPDQGETIELIRRRRFPIVADGTAVWSFVHVEDAAAATVAAVSRGAPGIYNIVDDHPASVAEWLPAVAVGIGAKPPRRVPRWIGRLFAGEAGVVVMTEVRGASNEKAKRELRWQPKHSWRSSLAMGAP